MHAYERDLHLILTSRPWSLYGSALMETALKPNLRPSSFNAARNERMASACALPIVDLPHNDTPDTPDVAGHKIRGCDCDGERNRARPVPSRYHFTQRRYTPGRGVAQQQNCLTRDEARRIAAKHGQAARAVAKDCEA